MTTCSGKTQVAWGSISTDSSNPSVWNSNGATYDPSDFMSDWRILLMKAIFPLAVETYIGTLLSVTYGDGRKASFAPL